MAIWPKPTHRLAQVDETVTLVGGDACDFLTQYQNIAFCILDAEKEIYGELNELIIPCLVQSGLLLADNAINHRESLKPMLDRALTDQQVDALIVPIGKGVLVCRKI